MLANVRWRFCRSFVLEMWPFYITTYALLTVFDNAFIGREV